MELTAEEMELTAEEVEWLESSKTWKGGEVYIPNRPYPRQMLEALAERGLVRPRLCKLAPMAMPVTLYFITDTGQAALPTG